MAGLKEDKKLKKLTVYFTYDEETKLSQLADTLKLSKTNVIREAFTQWLETNDKQYNKLFNFDEEDLMQIGNDIFRFKKVIRLIVDRISKILDAEMAGVMLYDEKTNELVLQKPAFGLENEEDINAYRVPINSKGNAVNVFLTGVPSISNDTPSDPRFLKQFVLKYGAYNTISVPLEVNSRRIGVIHVDNKKNGSFTQKDVELLMLLSSHMAILLENAAYFEKEKKQSQQLKIINLDLDNQQKELRRLMDIHGKLIRKVLYGEGLSAITMTLAELLNCTVIVEDKHFNIVCQALPERDDDVLQPEELLKEVKNLTPISNKCREATLKKKIVCIAPLPEKGINYFRILVPLTNKSGILGYLSVLFRNKTYDEFDMIAIEQAALVASLELVKEKNAYEIESRIKGEFLDLLLQGDFKNEKVIFERAKFLNYDIFGSQLVAVIRIQKAPSSKKDISSFLLEAINYIVFLVKRCLPQSILLTMGNEVIILSSGDEIKNLMDKLRLICIEIEQKYASSQVCIGIGQESNEILKIKESFQQAKKVLDVLTVFNLTDKVVTYNDLGIYSLLFHVDDKQILQSFVNEKLGALIKYDNKKGSLLLTLEVLLQKKCILKKAAEELFIHIKTIEYRVRKIEEILNVTLSDAEVCFELNMAIKINHLLSFKY